MCSNLLREKIACRTDHIRNGSISLVSGRRFLSTSVKLSEASVQSLTVLCPVLGPLLLLLPLPLPLLPLLLILPLPKITKTTTTCGAVFAKWFMVLQDGDEKKTAAQESKPTIEEEEEEIASICSRPSIKEVSRPSIKEVSRSTIKELSRLSISEDEDEEIVSVCPPKNALLLMRCRSDPLRMSPLDNERGCKSEPMRMSCTIRHSGDEDEYEDEYEYEDRDEDEDEDEDEGEVYKTDFEEAEEQPIYSPEALEVNICAEEEEDIEKEIQAVMAVANAVLEEVSETGPQAELEAEARCDTELDTETGIAQTIPNALLLMMSEPKLSMEISKETWVSREDFVNARRPVHVVKMDADGDKDSDDDKENEQSREVCNVEEASNHSMSRMKDQNVGPCETCFVLPRCKSEPLRASVKLVPEACFWKPRNLEIPSFIIRGPPEIGAHQA
ncbi:hypothetical protein KI387_041161 [Taxus chinensis]|uniref:Uncharacterized protein n=1 Tax=Taxus chinensis TaxID=29808 RepID=A0AA38C2L7_TAXCH|nr:hypothetical protein KI387_041161 [Taxus chinensis]